MKKSTLSIAIALLFSMNSNASESYNVKSVERLTNERLTITDIEMASERCALSEGIDESDIDFLTKESSLVLIASKSMSQYGQCRFVSLIDYEGNKIPITSYRINNRNISSFSKPYGVYGDLFSIGVDENDYLFMFMADGKSLDKIDHQESSSKNGDAFFTSHINSERNLLAVDSWPLTENASSTLFKLDTNEKKYFQGGIASGFSNNHLLIYKDNNDETKYNLVSWNHDVELNNTLEFYPFFAGSKVIYGTNGGAYPSGAPVTIDFEAVSFDEEKINNPVEIGSYLINKGGYTSSPSNYGAFTEMYGEGIIISNQGLTVIDLFSGNNHSEYYRFDYELQETNNNSFLFQTHSYKEVDDSNSSTVGYIKNGDLSKISYLDFSGTILENLSNIIKSDIQGMFRDFAYNINNHNMESITINSYIWDSENRVQHELNFDLSINDGEFFIANPDIYNSTHY